MTQLCIKNLKTTDIQSYLDLQKSLIDQTQLPCGQYAMKKRDAGHLKDHIEAGMPIVGMFNAQNELQAAAMVTYPDNEAARHVDCYPLNDSLSETFIIHGLCVSQSRQGAGLSGQVMAQAFNAAAADERHIAYAKFASMRISPRRAFEKAGFSIAKLEFGQGNDYDVTCVRKVGNPAIKRSSQMPLYLPESSQFRYG